MRGTEQGWKRVRGEKGTKDEDREEREMEKGEREKQHATVIADSLVLYNDTHKHRIHECIKTQQHVDKGLYLFGSNLWCTNNFTISGVDINACGKLTISHQQYITDVGTSYNIKNNNDAEIRNRKLAIIYLWCTLMSKDFGLFFHLLKPESWDSKVRSTERWDLQWGEIYSKVWDLQWGEIYSKVWSAARWNLQRGETYNKVNSTGRWDIQLTTMSLK